MYDTICLIVELSSTQIGCSVDNNISYAVDEGYDVPSISALRKLVAPCELYHGFRYNVIKNELLVFRADSKCKVKNLVKGFQKTVVAAWKKILRNAVMTVISFS